MLAAGSLDRRVTLQRDGEETRNELNEPVFGPPVEHKVWASYRRATARERLASQQVGAEISSVFEVRWSSQTREMDATWRVIFEGRTYRVTGVFEIGRREGLRIEAVARGESGENAA